MEKYHNNKIQKEDSKFICLSVVLINSVFRTGKSYYHQVFLEECKYIVKKMPIEISSDSDREISDEEKSIKEISCKENSDEENFNEEN